MTALSAHSPVPPLEVQRALRRFRKIVIRKTGKLDLSIRIERAAGPTQPQQLAHCCWAELRELALQCVDRLVSRAQRAGSMQSSAKHLGVNAVDLRAVGKNMQRCG